jgi:ribonuclease P protein component
VTSGRVARETFSRGDRLRKRTEFEECYSGGVRVSGRHFQLFLRRRTTDAATGTSAAASNDPPRLGISVSKRVGNAVVRNRVKRRLREIFRRQRPDQPVDIVIHARPSAATATFQELARELPELISRALARPGRPTSPAAP